MPTASEAYCGVELVNTVAVQLDEAPWHFAIQNGEKISAFWRTALKTHPHFYDGQVHVMTSWEIRGAQSGDAAFIGNLCRTNFASFLYWKASATHSRKEVDFSGGAALLCRDGALLMVLTGDHTIAPGTLEFPSGFVDVADFDDNVLNFDRHVEREVTEELAIKGEDLSRPIRYLVSEADGVVQVLSIFNVDTNGDEFAASWRSRSGILRSEISDIVAIYRSTELGAFATQAHVKAALSYLLTFG
jgi:8-oxo-dGTP pyrophosphatase MutT (NUDIX family)